MTEFLFNKGAPNISRRAVTDAERRLGALVPERFHDEALIGSRCRSAVDLVLPARSETMRVPARVVDQRPHAVVDIDVVAAGETMLYPSVPSSGDYSMSSSEPITAPRSPRE